MSPLCRQGGVWRQAEKPLFDVQHLTYKLKGNNVPMPSTLVKHLLRVFIPEIIQVGCGAACCCCTQLSRLHSHHLPWCLLCSAAFCRCSQRSLESTCWQVS